MASSFKSSKRPYERNPLEPNGRGKWQKTGPNSSSQNQLKIPPIPPGATVFRVLCPSSKFGSIIGKGGGIVSKIRQETGAKVRIEDSVPGCDERVVVITGSEKEAKSSNERSKEDQEETGAADGGVESKASEENNDKKEDSSAVEDSKSEKAMPSAQKALMLVYERLIEGEPDDAGDEEQNKSNSVSVRLLIRSSQVGCLLGKGGIVIKQLSSDSGAQLQIFSKDAVPLCASPIDEVVQFVGGVDSVRNAIQSVSQLLLENPPRDSFPASNPSGPSHHFPSFPRPEVLPPATFLPHAQGPPFLNRPFDNPDFHPSIPPSFPKFHDGAAPGQFQFPPEPITYRLLCSSDKVGSLIGKGGSIIKTIQHETGCEIKIHEAASESDEQIVSVSGPTFPGDRISPPQDAILRILERIIVPVPDKRDSMVSRLLVSSNQTGCLIGKGGSIIADMRKVSGAQIRILAKDQLPKSVGENDDVVQAIGEFRAVQEAVVQITSKLRDHLFRDKVPQMNHAVLPPVDQMPPFGPFMGRREPSPPRPYSNFPPFQIDAVGRLTEERSAFPHPLHSSAVPYASERMPPAPWTSQGMREGGGPMPLPDFPGAHRRLGGFPGGNQPAVITNTTVDVVVPRALVPTIYGEDGFCLRRIREISEAKITITEPRPEATETVIIISGSPEQTGAAQSLLQAFVLSESGGP